MAQYKILKRCNLEYNKTTILKECLVYKGGKEIKENAHLFLKRLHQESDSSYQERLDQSAYLPLVGKFVDFFVASLFSKDVSVIPIRDEDSDSLDYDKEFWNSFAANCNLYGKSFQSFLRDSYKKALIHQDIYVGIDFPRSDAIPDNLQQQKDLGQLNGYVYEIDPETMIDWFIDPASNELVWLKLQEDLHFQPDPLDEPMHILKWTCWTLDNNRAKVEIYQSKPLKLDEEPKESEEIPTISTFITDFPCIPIKCLSMPDGLAIGAKLGPLAEEHFQRRSVEHSYTNKACVPIPVIKKGPSIPAEGESINPIALNRFRGNDPVAALNSRGYTEIGSEDSLEIVESEGKALQFIHTQNKDLIEEMHSIVNQLSTYHSKNSSSQKQSAQSKIEDRHSTEIMLTDYAELVEEFAINIYNLISMMRGEDIKWTARGLNTATYVDRAQLIDEATKMQNIGISAPIFKEKYQYQTATAVVPNFSEEEEHILLEQIQSTAELEVPQNNSSQSPSHQQDPNISDDSSATQDLGDLLGESGHETLPEGAHLQEPGYVDPSEVYNLLKGDYQEKDIAWVNDVAWKGPVELPLSSLDFSNMQNWNAIHRLDKIQEFKNKVTNDNWSKPIIVVNEVANNKKMIILDGHTRSIAYLEMDKPIPAFVGHIGKLSKDMKQMHDLQKAGESGGKRNSNPEAVLKAQANDDNPNQQEYKSKKTNNITTKGSFNIV